MKSHAPLLADISRLSNIQQCNSIHRYPTDYNDFEENEKLRKRQKEVDEDIAKVFEGDEPDHNADKKSAASSAADEDSDVDLDQEFSQSRETSPNVNVAADVHSTTPLPEPRAENKLKHWAMRR
ncbi:hypothetical protein EB796_000603 [Bugula neritina]|uniref:Uncharacterized protein n=1 Tax=Bugula neritina TaxID=10212 RepID=A0A7J7KSL3_BUGNE|nr:hypothetical protein EB796_000603 [Bugula neritina]